MEINDAGLELIKRFEGVRLSAYQDVAGTWTIGYGHTRGVFPTMHITEQQAETALKDDLDATERVVTAAVARSATSGNQFAAMVALCFNIGSANFRGSTVIMKHRDRDYQAAADAFVTWNKAHVGGVLTEVPGLTARRRAERQLYLT